MKRIKRLILVVAAVAALAGGAVIVQQGVTATAHPAAAFDFLPECNDSLGANWVDEPFPDDGIWGGAGCNSSGPGAVIETACVEIYSIYGWIVDETSAGTWGTACNNEEEGPSYAPLSLFGVGVCYPGTWSYRTMYSTSFENSSPSTGYSTTDQFSC